MSEAGIRKAWTWQQAIARSDLPSTTRHVLLTLALFMDQMGKSCFPSIDNLVEASGLSKRTIIEHLKIAAEVGWLRKGRHGYRGQKWRRAEYEAAWPGRDVADEPGSGSGEGQGGAGEQGGAGDAPASDADVVQEAHQGGAGDAPKAVQEMHQDKDQSSDQSSTSPRLRCGAGAGESENDPKRRTWTRAELDAITDRAIEAGAIGGLSPTWIDISPLIGLIEAGYDLEADILPKIRELTARRGKPVRSTAYFVEPVREAGSQRRAIAAGGAGEAGSGEAAAGGREPARPGRRPWQSTVDPEAQLRWAREEDERLRRQHGGNS